MTEPTPLPDTPTLARLNRQAAARKAAATRKAKAAARALHQAQAAGVCAHESRAWDGWACILYAGHRGDHRYRALADLAGGPFKVCPRCDVAQPLATSFQHRSNGTVFSWCKGCNTDYAKARRAAKAAGQ